MSARKQIRTRKTQKSATQPEAPIRRQTEEERTRQSEQFLLAVHKMSTLDRQWMAGLMAVVASKEGTAGVIKRCELTLTAFRKAGAR